MSEHRSQRTGSFFETEREVRRLFQELIHQPWGGKRRPQPQGWQPSVDAWETDEALMVEIDLPGVTRKDITIEVEGDVLHISGEQGVIIPQANVRNLMLRPDVVEAVRTGQFHVYPITHVDQGLALLTGVAAGDKSTPDTVHGMVNAQLQRLAREITAFSGENSHNGAHVPSGSADDTC